MNADIAAVIRSMRPAELVRHSIALERLVGEHSNPNWSEAQRLISAEISRRKIPPRELQRLRRLEAHAADGVAAYERALAGFRPGGPVHIWT